MLVINWWIFSVDASGLVGVGTRQAGLELAIAILVEMVSTHLCEDQWLVADDLLVVESSIDPSTLS